MKTPRRTGTGDWLRPNITNDLVPPLSRRQFMAWTAGAALGAAWLASVRGAAAQGVAASGDHELPSIESIPDHLKGSGQVVVATWGGVGTEMQRPAYYEPFTKLTGIEVVEAVGPSAAKVRAMVDAKNVEWDVVQTSRGTVIELERLGNYFHEIDYGLVDIDNIAESYRHPKSLDMLPYAQIYAYRADEYSKEQPPRTWGDFWDVAKFPGPRTQSAATDGNYAELVGALIADGVEPTADAIYPIDIDRAFDSLAKIKPHIVKWWTSGAEPLQMLADKEALMAGAWNARIAAIQAAGVPVEIAWEGGTLFSNSWAVPNGAPNLENAMKFIGFTTMAQPQARYSMLLPYGYTNGGAGKLIPDDIAANLPTTPHNLEKLIPQDVEWWAENRPKVIDRWTSWVLE